MPSILQPNTSNPSTNAHYTSTYMIGYHCKLLHRGPIPLEQSLCPSCQQESKNHWHFLECRSPKQDNLYKALLKDLKQQYQKHNFDNKLYHLLQAGLSTSDMQYHHWMKPQHSPCQYKSYFGNKHKLVGISQLFYGHISVSWVHYIDIISNGHTNGTILFSDHTVHHLRKCKEVLTSIRFP